MDLSLLYSRCRAHVRHCLPQLRERGITEDQATEWGIGYDHEGLTRITAGRITIPVWHPWSGFPVTVTARRTGDSGPKWMHIPFPSSRMVFGKVRRHRLPYLVLVEGPADVIALESHGIHAVALFGVRDLSGWQLGLLRRWTDTFVIYSDNDGHPVTADAEPNGGELARRRWAKTLGDAGCFYALGPYPDHEGDPDVLVRRRPEFVHQIVESVVRERVARDHRSQDLCLDLTGIG